MPELTTTPEFASTPVALAEKRILGEEPMTSQVQLKVMDAPGAKLAEAGTGPVLGATGWPPLLACMIGVRPFKIAPPVLVKVIDTPNVWGNVTLGGVTIPKLARPAPTCTVMVWELLLAELTVAPLFES